MGAKPNWKDPRKRTRMRTTRMLLLRIWVRRELPKIKESGLEETQKTAAKMIAARPMPEPQKTRKTFLGGGDIEERAKLMKEGPAQRICSTHLKTGSNNNSERRNLGCEIIVSYVCIGNQIFHIELMMS